ncbi:MAG TPA: rhomboid family intramembrane serine protease [Acidobacteriota bacterium]|jgi:membrane associated rhomboid family serine protease|nr:rhomboid family intramembrane serine protease [Acidobacteriota bacterium]
MIPFRDNIPSRRYPLVTLLIIIVNIAAFVYQLTLPPQELKQLVGLYGVVPARLLSTAEYPVQILRITATSLVVSMFLHGGWFHLIGNMWYLWIFGDNVEDRMGHFRFLLFYLLCGFAASFVHILFNLNSPIPSIGASGAIAGVLGAYFVSYPFARVLTLVPFFFIWPVVELPALIVLGSWFFVQLLNGSAAVIAAAQTTGGVAWWAHIGGFLAGMILLGVFAQKRPRRYSWEEI